MNKEERRAAREAWTAAYLAASEEERKNMLKEKAEKHRKEEAERNERIAAERRARFMERSDKQLAIYETLEKAQEIVLKYVEKFDGKVLNARLSNAIDKEFTETIDTSLRASLKIDSTWSGKRDVRLKVNFYGNYGFEDQVSISIFETYEGRINAKETVDNFKSYLPERIDSLTQAKKDYDAALETALKIENEIEKYRHAFHYSLRDYFRKECLTRDFM